MGFFEAIKAYVIKWSDFKGRSSRSEYWWVYLPLFIITLVLENFFSNDMLSEEFVVAVGEFVFAIAVIIFLLIFLLMMLAGIALTVRRLHDINLSGWWYFIGLIPFIGSFILLLMACIKGTDGENRFGADPLADNSK